MSGVLAAYEALIAAGELRPDTEQAAAAARLDALAGELEHPRTTGLFRRKPVPARGVYLWGDVGRGKSMLMDFFFRQLALPESGPAPRRQENAASISPNLWSRCMAASRSSGARRWAIRSRRWRRISPARRDAWRSTK